MEFAPSPLSGKPNALFHFVITGTSGAHPNPTMLTLAHVTSGGLHGVGVSVVNALSTQTIVEVARDKKLYRQTFSRGVATSKLIEVGAAPNRRGTKITGGVSFTLPSMPACGVLLKNAESW